MISCIPDWPQGFCVARDDFELLLIELYPQSELTLPRGKCMELYRNEQKEND